MELKNVEASEMEARLAEIAGEIDAEDADLDALEAEARAIRAEIDQRKANEEKRSEIRDVVAMGGGETVKTFETEERKTMDLKEIRSSDAYVNAFAKYIKTEDDTECRALLTENVSGSVPVPVFVEGIISEAVRNSEILSRVRKTYAAGNVKIGFEVSAPLAGVHTEGGDPIAEEDLELGIVTLVPQTLKKWVSISDEALDTMAGDTYLSFLYSEVMRNIIKAEEKMVVDAILAAPQVATSTAPAVAEHTISAAGLDDFISARALLTSDASNLVIIITPADYAAYKGLAISAGFAFDPFEGIRVIFNDYATAPIIGDLSGVLANYPNGDNVQFKYDDRTLMTSDLVRVLGRLPVAIGVVANDYFAKITTE